MSWVTLAAIDDIISKQGELIEDTGGTSQLE